MDIMVTERERDLILAALRDLIEKAERNRSFVIGAEKRQAWKAQIQVTRDLLGRLVADKAIENLPLDASWLRTISRNR